MKTEIKMRTMICLVAGLLVASADHAAAATEEKPTVMVSLSQLNTELRTLRENLSRTIAALENVKAAANKDADLSKPFANFSSAWTEFERQVAKVRQDGIATKARAKEHWEAWHTELVDMQNPKLREKAQKRYASTTKEFEKISEKVADAKEDFAPLQADLKDVHTYLQTDLSKEAVSSLSSTIWKMGNQAHTVDGELAGISKQIERTLSKLPQS
jgi:predicted  nucleic acid-binding Zn-ribbon protein